MLRFVSRRLVAMIPVLAIASIAVFSIVRLSPGDPALAVAGTDTTPQRLTFVRHQLGLDHPFVQQYFHWVSHAVVGDFGTSVATSSSVSSLLGDRIPATAQLAVLTMVVSVALGVAMGVVAAARPRSLAAKFVSLFSSVALAVPAFFLAVLFVLVFGVALGWFPTSAEYVPFWQHPWDAFYGVIGPIVTLTPFISGIIARFVRASMTDVLGREYVRAARARGAGELTVLFRHAFRNAALPTLTVVGVQLGTFLGGAVVIESIFSYPGLGRLTYGAVLARDFPLIQGAVLFVIVAFMLVTLAVDVLYAALNPRIRLS